MRKLLEHHKYCRSRSCLLCVPVNQYADEGQRLAMAAAEKFHGCSLATAMNLAVSGQI